MSLFGQNQSSGTSLFGQSAQNQQKPGLFGSLNTNVSQPQQTGGLFGSSTTSQPQQVGGLFGSSNTQQQQSGSLFGQANTSQPQQPASLFGTSQPQQQSGGSLFNQSSQAQQTNSLFGGNLGQAQTQQSQQQGSSFLGGANTQQPKPTLSLFGGANQQNQQQQQQQQRPSLFSSLSTSQAPQQQSSLFSNSVLPALGTSQPQQQTVPGVKIDVSNLRGTTRFNDLHEELQKSIEQIDNFIQNQIQFKEQCDALMPAHGSNLETVPNDVKVLSGMVDTVELAMDNDTRDINAVKELVAQDVENSKISFRAIENLKLPQQFHYSGMYYGRPSTASPSRALVGSDADGDKSPADLVSYFNSTATDLSKTMDTYKTQLAEIEDHMRMVEGNAIVQSQEMAFKKGADGGERSQADQVQELSAVLNSFWNSINGVAEKVGSARHEVQQYTLNGRKR